jgi:hypothetical protein
MRRRSVIGLVASVSGIAGCSGESDTATVVETRSVDPAVINQSVNQVESGQQYEATIENSGIEGSVRVKLYWQYDDDSGESLATSTNTTVPDGGRDTVEIVTDRPETAAAYSFRVQPRDFAADIRNTGSDAEIQVQLIDEPSGTVVRETVVSMAGGETRTVRLTAPDGIAGSYTVQAIKP